MLKLYVSLNAFVYLTEGQAPLAGLPPRTPPTANWGESPQYPLLIGGFVIGRVCLDAIQPTRRARLGDACGISLSAIIIAEAVGILQDSGCTTSSPFARVWLRQPRSSQPAAVSRTTFYRYADDAHCGARMGLCKHIRCTMSASLV